VSWAYPIPWFGRSGNNHKTSIHLFTSWETWLDGLRDDLLLVWVVAFLEGVICCLTDAFYLIEI
jgi:hypothetical protein